MTKVLAGAAAIASAAAVAIYALPTFTGIVSSVNMLPWTLAISLGALAALVVLISKTVMTPLKDVTEAVRVVAKGNFKVKVYPGKITKSTVKNADEFDRAILMLELLRRKVLEVKKDLNDSMKQKAIDLQRINDELTENEQILKKANTQLEAQAEEFKRVNEELSRKNEELLEANGKLKDLDRMKDDFISVAAHELCIPLEPILDSVDQLEQGTIADEEAWKSIISGSRQLVGVANNILDVGRIEGGTFDYKMGPVSVKKLIEELSVIFTGQKGKAGTSKLNFDMDPDGDIMLTGDRKRLLQALSAIVGNSVNFSKQGAITVQVRANHDEGSVKIRVTDEGPPFPADMIPALFDKYAATMRESERGTGLGFFITKTIVEAHAGAISVENNPSEKGVSFTISLPTIVRKEVSQIAQA
jgi:signal transduction histidine kinase